MVYHNGAIVNSVLPFASVKASNVAGTSEIIKLCILANSELHHVSTIGMLSGTGSLYMTQY